MAEKQKRQPVMISPAGIAVYPHLHEPDNRFDGQEAKFKIKLRLDPNEGKNAEFIAKLEELREAALPEMKAKFPKFAARMKLEYDVVKEEFDSEGSATGFVLIEFKSKASFKSKTTGKTIPLTPKLFDSKNRALPKGVRVGSGSTVKVAFTPGGFAFSNTKVGLSLRLEAVQVIDLVEPGSFGAAPFEAMDGGYEADESDTPFESTEESSSNDSTEEGNDEDF